MVTAHEFCISLLLGVSLSRVCPLHNFMEISYACERLCRCATHRPIYQKVHVSHLKHASYLRPSQADAVQPHENRCSEESSGVNNAACHHVLMAMLMNCLVAATRAALAADFLHCTRPADDVDVSSKNPSRGAAIAWAARMLRTSISWRANIRRCFPSWSQAVHFTTVSMKHAGQVSR